MNATQDPSPRRLDEKATRAARERQYAGIALFRAIFGWTPGEAEARRVARRVDQGSGPVSVDGRPHPTRARVDATRAAREGEGAADRAEEEPAVTYELPSDVQTRPIVRWPGPLTPDYQRRRSPFSAGWRATMDLLDRELTALGATAVVLQVAMAETDFRIDGLPRANARAAHPGVILSFNTAGYPEGSALNGRLEFATDIFRTWEENLRAIALGLEALRKVDRYGITRGDAQYAGFKALPRGDDGSMGLYDTAAARDWLQHRYGGDLRAALRATHPDSNPDADPDEYRRVIRAKELLES